MDFSKLKKHTPIMTPNGMGYFISVGTYNKNLVNVAFKKDTGGLVFIGEDYRDWLQETIKCGFNYGKTFEADQIKPAVKIKW